MKCAWIQDESWSFDGLTGGQILKTHSCFGIKQIILLSSISGVYLHTTCRERLGVMPLNAVVIAFLRRIEYLS